MSKILTFPVIPRPTAEQRSPLRIPIPIVDHAADSEKQRQIKRVRDDFAHATRKLMVVAEANDELPWAIRLIEQTLIDIKQQFGSGTTNE